MIEKSEFQPIPEYEDYDRSPFTVTSQTFKNLELHYSAGSFFDSSQVSEYINTHILPFLKKAANACDNYIG